MNQFAKALAISLALLSPVAALGAEKGKSEQAPAGKIYKVADIYKDKAKLDNQKVTVKGKVVKISAGIMGKNWLHIQDGSGNAANKTNDLTVTTTQNLPETGKTVTVTGTLHKDKDFGAGYFYSVIVEDAVIK
ncbi:MAG TPA: hypothetical protein VF775_02365 [Geobacteraceae bacterium]